MDAIVAVYADWGIGAKGTQPLVIPADRRRFRELTMGAAVIVGRRTLDDFPGGRPLPGRNVTPQGDRPAVLEEQYDAVQHAARGGAPGNAPYDIPEAPAQPVVQKVEIPQVPPKEPPESGSQIPFGKPHAPRAMPLAPFGPYTPHTAP